MTDAYDILTVLPNRYPSRLIGLELPLATIEELDLLHFSELVAECTSEATAATRSPESDAGSNGG